MISVREALEQDGSAIEAVCRAAEADLRKVYRPNRKALENRAAIASSLTRLVALVGDEVVGTVMFRREPDRLHLMGLSVHINHRRIGVARSLVAAVEREAKRHGLRRLSLYTVRETGNVAVFERMGFRVVGEQEDRWSESDVFAKLTGVEMEKAIG
jgi:ribosomal protein S18 acetylase RimI-like enzyme